MTQQSLESDSEWSLGTALVNFPGGGIVHAYPGARFLSVMHHEGDRVLVTFLDRAPPDIKDVMKPNAEEVEYFVRIVGPGDSVKEPVPEFIGAFSSNNRPYVAFFEPLFGLRA